MIPTTVSSSPSTATASGSGGPGGGINASSNNGSNSTSQNGQQNSVSVMIGMASLILEGRAVADESFQPPQLSRIGVIIDGTCASGINSSGGSGSGSGSGGSHNSSSIGGFSHNSSASNTSPGLSGSGGSVGSGSIFSGGRQSPTCRPSTSRAATSFGGHVINITTNPCAFPSVGVASGSHMHDVSPLCIDPYTACSSTSSSAAESTHQRWTQKLCQLRQVSPAASLSSAYEQPVAVEAREPEIVALAINESGPSECGEFEIIRRSQLNRPNVANTSVCSGSAGPGSASSSPGSGAENFQFSLQSLATTRLRSGSPSLEMGSIGSGSGGYRYSALSSSPLAQSMYIYRTATPTTHRYLDPPGSGSSSGSGIQSPRPSWPSLGGAATATNINNPTTHHSKDKFLRQTTTMTAAAAAAAASASAVAATTPLGRAPVPGITTNWPYGATMATAATAIASTKKVASAAAPSSTYPQQGPHCDQFLRKMGLAKGETAEAEEHICDMSYVNITCSRWRAYCHKMETIIERGKPVCIEVYLGPVNHKILLEQWIITQKEKVPPPTMTLPSLCSAIRSQLYFSQISAWCDLIKKSDTTIYDTGRIIFPTPTGAAGDLATPSASAASAAAAAVASVVTTGTGGNSTPGTSPTTVALNQLSSVMLNRRPRLNIFYRIKSFDSTACFNSKPNVHNFPNVNISENCSISVCLKSLPRINGGIPKIGTLTMSTASTTLTTTTATTTAAATMPTIAANESTVISTPMTATSANGTTNNNGTTLHRYIGTGNSCSNNNRNSNGSSSSNNSTERPSTSRSSLNGRQSGSVAPVAVMMNVADCDSKKTRAFAAISTRSTECPVSGDTPLVNSSSTTSASSSASGSSASSNGNSVSSSSNSHSNANKPKCMFFIDEEELNADDADGCIAADDDDNRSDTANSTGDSTASTSAFSSSANMSHREKQLLKYRKRMMKRDKKHQHQRKPLSTTSDASCELGAAMELQRRQHERNERNERKSSCDRHCYQPMEEGDEESCVPEMVRSATVVSVGSAQIEMISTGTQTPMTCCQHCGREKTLICLKCSRDGMCGDALSRPPHIIIPTDLDVDEMDDSASSISSIEIIHTPRNKAELLLQAIQRTPKVAKHKKQSIRESNGSLNGSSGTGTGTGLGIGNSATCLSTKLQNNNHLNGVPTTNGQQSNGSAAAGSNNGASINGSNNCQVCKRQKTQHNFGARNGAAGGEDTELLADEEDEGDGGRSSDYFRQETTKEAEKLYDAVEDDEQEQMETQTQPQTSILTLRTEVMEEESFVSSTKLTPHIDRCTLSSSTMYQLSTGDRAGGDTGNGGNNDANKPNRSCTPPNLTLINNGAFDESQFKTPTSAASSNFGHGHQQLKQQNSPLQSTLQPAFQHKQTPKPNLLQISCSYHGENMHAAGAAGDGFALLRASDELPTSAYTTTSNSQLQKQQQLQHNSMLLRKGLPKVNLTPIFCNPIPAATITSSHSSPIPIHGATQDTTFLFDSSAMHSSNININKNTNANVNAHGNANANTTDNNIPVQKSYSAPTLPNSPSLSPRFAKQAAIYKRRSRHLSDRSDRSSLGSDEQFSDEDLENGGIYSPATSPLKQRARVAAAFGRQPLLGNLEESLLQKRLMPKVEVMGFKVLLGASGGFCPTQLTIPAAAYFYELHGETLSTPYVCDIRLPRKGYSVPRAGTVQATLLNPMGTVVRMFVIPYDMRDMPPLHQTFIRQRILAEASSNEANGSASLATSALGVGQQTTSVPYLNGFGSNESANSATNNNNNESFINSNKSGNGNNNNNNTNMNAGNKYRLSPSGGLHGESNLGHFISAEHMKRLRYSIHLRFQTSRSGRLSLHTDIRLLISRRTDCDTAAAHAKGVLEAPNDLVTDTVMPANPKYSARQESNNNSSSKI